MIQLFNVNLELDGPIASMATSGYCWTGCGKYHLSAKATIQWDLQVHTLAVAIAQICRVKCGRYCRCEHYRKLGLKRVVIDDRRLLANVGLIVAEFDAP